MSVWWNVDLILFFYYLRIEKLQKLTQFITSCKFVVREHFIEVCLESKKGCSNEEEEESLLDIEPQWRNKTPQVLLQHLLPIMMQICLNMLYINNRYRLKWKNYRTHLNNVNGGYSKLEQRRWVMRRQWHAWFWNCQVPSKEIGC